MELTGDRITLREHVGEDWAPLAAYQGDARYLQFNPADGSVPAQARRLVELFVTWAGQQPRENYQLGIVHRVTERLIGSAGLRTAGMAPGCAEFGLELSPDWWGRGLAAESSRLLLGFGFETLALEQIRGVSVTANAQVARLVRRLGFVEGATLAGNAWMRARAWTFTEWVLTKDAW
jgi:ribosomal-protein-alanine N-acetyltransferase